MQAKIDRTNGSGNQNNKILNNITRYLFPFDLRRSPRCFFVIDLYTDTLYVSQGQLYSTQLAAYQQRRITTSSPEEASEVRFRTTQLEAMATQAEPVQVSMMTL